MKIGYLASGALGLSNLKSCEEYFRPSFIATDIGSIELCNYATEQGIPLFKENPREGRLSAFLSGSRYDLILSVNYLYLIEPDIFSASDYIINFHGSLLPKYRGRTPHVWAIINNEKKTGITAHFIDANCDTGNIIFQKEIEIEDEDTGASILRKYEKCYPEMVVKIIKDVRDKCISSYVQDETRATYFGKRTPDDGEINWNWHKERIRNWVRAQSFPYPGAYTWIDNEKIILDHISFSDCGFDYSNPNGLVLEVSPEVLVKTPNGVVKLDGVRINENKIQKGLVLGK